jgi:ATP-binding cassette subfamily C protein LapB
MKRVRHLRGIAWTPSIVVSSLLSNVLALALPLSLIHVYDRIIPLAGVETLTVLWIGIGVAALCDVALRLARAHLVERKGIGYELEMRRLLLDCLLLPGARSASARSDAEIRALFTGVERIRRRRSGEMAKAILDVPFIVVFAGILAMISVPLALTVCAVTLCCVLIVFALRRESNRLVEARFDDDTSYAGFLDGVFRQYDTIRDLALGERVRREVESRTARSSRTTEALTRSRLQTRNAISTIAMISPVIVAAAGAGLAITGQMSVGGLAATVVLTGRIVQPSLNIEAILMSDRDVKQAERAIDAVLAQASQRQPQERVDAIESLSIPMSDGSPLVLRAGDCLLVNAENPSDVSRLFDRLAGCADPDGAGIEVNGLPLGRVSADSLAESIALIRSDHTVLGGSLIENLTGFEPVRHGERAMDLATKLGLDQVIAETEHGLHTRLSHGDMRKLSRSTGQLIQIVSGLAKKPDVVLFLEANVDLDPGSDRMLRNVLAYELEGCISLIFSRRPSYQALATHEARLAGDAMERVFDDGYQAGKTAVPA